MKKRLFSILLSICMVFTMIPMAGGAVFAETDSQHATSVTIAGNTLDANNTCYYNGTDGAAGTVGNDEDTANAIFDATTGTLTLKDINVNYTNSSRGAIYWSSYKHLTIDVETNSNFIKNGSDSALNGAVGYSGNGPSLTIKGTGSLKIEGKYGIWVWKNITIVGNVNVDITATVGGIYNNDTSGKITIKDNANVTIDSNGYGIGYDNGNSNIPLINGGTLTVKGTTATMMKAPAFDDESKYQITASTSKTGELVITYNAANISSYKYLKIESKPAVTEEVGIYLRTRLVNDDTPADATTDSNIQLTLEQLDELGLVSSDARNDGYSDSDKYGYWVSYGTFPSAKAATYNHVTQERGSEGVTAVTNEMASSTVTKKEKITFNGLDKVTWDTLSWSPEGSKYAWHLNGEIRLCKISFSMMSGAGEGADRYAVYNTSRSDGLITVWPADPTRNGYTFDGWYTDTTGGTEITDDYKFTSNETIYAHWTKNPETSYDVTIYAGSGMTTTGKQIQKGVAGAITPVIFKAGNGYYFPEGYGRGELNGIRVTRDSYTQVTVSGTPTANTNFSLPNATAKEKAETPNLAVMQPVDGRDKGSIETTAAYEIRKDGESSYKDCTEGKTSLEPGKYYIRVKATDTALASDDQEIVINQPAEYTITFNANGGYFNDGANKQLTFKSGQVITALDKPSKSSSNKKYTYTFDDWYTDPGAGMRLNDDDVASKDVTYYAHWIETPKEYKITYETDDGTINDKDYKTTYTYETENIYFPTDVTRDGYTFKGWSTTKGTGNLLDSWKVTDDNLDDLTFYALWSAIRAEKPQVSIDPATLSINCGDTADITVTAEADKGAKYKLTYEWYESTGGSDENAALIDGATGNVYTVPADKEAGTYYYFCKVKATRTDNSEFVIVKSDVATVNVTKKSTGHYKPTQKPEIIAGEGVKAELRINGTKATITVEAGYEITDVLVNGVSIGKVTEITGLKTGDKVEIKTAKKQTEPEFNVKNYVKELTLAARSSKTAKGNFRIKVASVTDENGNPVDLSELKAKGYTVKYKFYRSEKKAAEYGARIEKDTDNNSYINNTGKKGAKYFYKVRVMVYDSNGNLAAKSELKQCKYATRIWSK